MPSAEAIIGLGQLLIALVVWFKVDARTIGKWFMLSDTPRNKVMLILILGGLAFSVYAVYASSHRYTTSVETLTGFTYANQMVEMDGRRFENCTFENSTLMYRGKGEVYRAGCRFVGNVVLTTDHPAITTFVRLGEYISSRPGVVEYGVRNIDEKGRLYREFRQKRLPSP